MKRSAIPEKTRAEVISAQNGKCALCPGTHPVDIHHIIPVHRGGTHAFNNLILLCPNHHSLADSGVLPPVILIYYKNIARSEPVNLSMDTTVIYEVTAHNIMRQLLRRYDSNLINFARSLLSLLQRTPGMRYRRVCLELSFGIMHASMHEEQPNVLKLQKLWQNANKMADELKEEGYLYRQLMSHYLGVIFHNAGKLKEAIVFFENTSRMPQNIGPRNEELIADASLACVRLSAAEHLTGDSETALHRLQAVIEELPSSSPSFADTNCFAQIKLAEHMLVRGKVEQAQEILVTTNMQLLKKEAVIPIFRVILLKDLAKTHVMIGDRDSGIRIFIKSIVLAEENGFHDQRRKILKVAAELGISAQELTAD